VFVYSTPFTSEILSFYDPPGTKLDVSMSFLVFNYLLLLVGKKDLLIGCFLPC
jgi:hypothetical protein